MRMGDGGIWRLTSKVQDCQACLTVTSNAQLLTLKYEHVFAHMQTTKGRVRESGRITWRKKIIPFILKTNT